MKLWIKAIIVGTISQLMPIGIISIGAGLESNFPNLATLLEFSTPILWLMVMVFYPFTFFLLPEEEFTIYPNYQPSFIERHSEITFVMNLMLYIFIAYALLHIKRQWNLATKT